MRRTPNCRPYSTQTIPQSEFSVEKSKTRRKAQHARVCPNLWLPKIAGFGGGRARCARQFEISPQSKNLGSRKLHLPKFTFAEIRSLLFARTIGNTEVLKWSDPKLPAAALANRL